ncbi:PLD nuclease N-terminal domain-containing protein [Saccharopolyspora sp. NPDC000359]|uniref:PLD nuclease N-terminal domain-containing protein n=1 Tax=Saccharopolyspora sp. NPDC000359 TaxID=3154251 RepID=UPI0033289DAC
MTPESVPTSLFLVLIGLIAVAYAVLVLSALIGVLRSELELVHKCAWTVAIFVLPFLGSVFWHLVGKNSRSARGTDQPVSTRAS